MREILSFCAHVWYSKLAAMKYGKSIGKYADARGISLTKSFTEAWRFHFRHEPNVRELWEDVRRYKELGAVPLYVSQFLRSPVSDYIPLKTHVGIPQFAT